LINYYNLSSNLNKNNSTQEHVHVYYEESLQRRTKKRKKCTTDIYFKLTLKITEVYINGSSCYRLGSTAILFEKTRYKRQVIGLLEEDVAGIKGDINELKNSIQSLDIY